MRNIELWRVTLLVQHQPVIMEWANALSFHLLRPNSDPYRHAADVLSLGAEMGMHPTLMVYSRMVHNATSNCWQYHTCISHNHLQQQVKESPPKCSLTSPHMHNAPLSRRSRHHSYRAMGFSTSVGSSSVFIADTIDGDFDDLLCRYGVEKL